MDPNYIENVRYRGFQPYKEERLVTKKPMQTNNYYKDYYGEISNNKNRNVTYFDKEPRWKTNYSKVILGSLDEIKKEDYANKKLNPLGNIKNCKLSFKKFFIIKINIVDYDFCHLPIDKSGVNQTTKTKFRYFFFFRNA